MKYNNKTKSLFSLKKVILIWVGSLMTFNGFGQETNLTKLFAPLFNDKLLVWSVETNSFRTGIRFESPTKEIDIWSLSSTNAGLVYVYAPSGKPPRLELRDTNGVIIPPIRNGIDGELAQRLPERALRKYPSDWHGVSYEYFGLAKNEPHILKTFFMDDVYQIKKEADYMLTVFPVIYKFETNREYADRIDLPSVTTKIHLAPN